MNPEPRCPGPPRISRRRMLQVGSIGLLGLGLPQVLRAATRPASSPAADACILLFLNGGPSHLDMWDMKPDAPAEIRGEFKPIATSLTGVQLSEHLPKMARLTHHCALVRSAHHSVNNAHAAAVYCGLTGHDRGDTNVAIGSGRNDQPAIGSVVGLLRPPKTPVVPYVSMPYITAEGAGGPPQPGFFGGLLGRPRDPLFMLRNPNAPNFALPELSLGPDVPPERFDARRRLIARLAGGGDGRAQEMSGFQARAFDLLTSPATQKAFELDREPLTVRDAYGRNIYGQSVLLARRLIEAGTRVACISWAPDANATWDTHGNNFTKLKNELLPQLDAALSSLLKDLIERGMLRRTLVVVMGEFGRSPKVNKAAGRDHWNFCYGLMLAGGGIRSGTVFGASDRIGARPSSNPVTPADVVATIYHCLGIANDLELQDRLSRPFHLVPWGSPIRELLA
ncbi:MAG TPA: DUF1501 domain-containing protein [Gemmataceae bacterium]|nr:DUF1501 domain-containing protein [Gemmataceae bacterium]